MRNAVVSRLLAVVLVLVPAAALCGGPVKIDVLYMNHGPLLSTLQDVKSVLAKYGPRVTVTWHDFESDEGRAFMQKKNVTAHVPLMIWMNDAFRQRVEGKDVAFTGFPTGSGPAFFQGKWTIGDLRKALDQLVSKK